MSKRRGVIMVVTLAVLVAVVAVLAAAAASQRLFVKAQINRNETLRAKAVAEAGIQRAIATLATQSPTSTLQTDDWYTLGNTGQDNFKLDDGTFRMQIVDANSLIDLNATTQQQLQNLGLTDQQIESFLDWKTPGTAARPNGAKDDYYNGLTNPYNTSQQSLKTIDELLLIQGFTPATLYQPLQQNTSSTSLSSTGLQGNSQDQPTLYEMATVDSLCGNLNAAGQPKTNINAAQQRDLISKGLPSRVAQDIISGRGRGTFMTMGDVLKLPTITNAYAKILLDNYDTSTNATLTGRYDLNTVSQAILNTIPNMTSDVVSAITSKQTNGGFTSLGDLATLPGVTLPMIQQFADMFTTNSQTFIVRVQGTVGTTTVPLEALVTLSNGSAHISKITIPPYNDMTTFWHWNAQTNNDVDLTTGGTG